MKRRVWVPALLLVVAAVVSVVVSAQERKGSEYPNHEQLLREVHAALKQGAASSAFLARAERLRRYRANAADAPIKTLSGGAPACGAETLGWPDELAEGPSD